MDKTIQTLLDILKITLLDKQVDFTIEDPKKLYMMAKENGLSGTIYKAVEDKVSDTAVLTRFKRDFLKYVADDEKKLDMRIKLTKLLNDNSIDHIYLKGSHLKQMYQKSYMRSMGDIDVLIKIDDLIKTREILDDFGFKSISKGIVHDCLFYGDIEVEIHHCLHDEEEYLNFDILNDVWNQSVIKELHEYTMEPEFELLFLLFHLKKHFRSGGVGLRSIIDIAIFLQNKSKEINKGLFQEMLVKTDMEKFFKNIVLLNDRCLGLDLHESFSIEDDLETEIYDDFTEFIMKSGIHGLGTGMNMMDRRFAVNEMENKSRINSFFKLVFPPLRTMRIIYPKMMKCKILLPIAWVRRWFTVLFKRTKKISVYSKLLKATNTEEIGKISEMMKKMGI